MDAAIIDREYGIDESRAYLFPHRKVAVEVAAIVMVEEDASDASLFFAVGDVKIFFCVLRKLWVEVGPKRIECLFRSVVEVESVFFERKSHRSQVVSSTEPPFVCGFDVADVKVDGWGVGVVHVGDEADTSGKEGPFSVGHREFVSRDARPVHGGFFKHITIDAGDFSSSPCMVVPWRAAKAMGWLERFEVGDNGVA